MIHILVRENLNGALFVLDCCFLFVLLRYLWWAFKNRGTEVFYDPWYAAAFFMALYFVGQVIRAGTIWVFLKVFNDGGGNWATSPILLVVSGVFAIVGLLAMIRYYSPAHWREKGWIISAILAIVILTTSHFVDYPGGNDGSQPKTSTSEQGVGQSRRLRQLETDRHRSLRFGSSERR